ncbi:hypothetical protein BJ684DRAFT_15017 [Piptocephalis cylindrospora]|uniref:Uncharacterized protein n=1 Tax=Piptocephalis cylindrospora TaxID=1907219 RepID=A0A4P9Y8J6_9FUNG|nr:hypothetical protein BJ684DRAFT_15017 [Piptocephalis cylindrospora]|eukprot:RKP14671.1 hypothetical protein BJ684DRAFT_15017 [Piptocephalis cylindrospora]
MLFILLLALTLASSALAVPFGGFTSSWESKVVEYREIQSKEYDLVNTDELDRLGRTIASFREIYDHFQKPSLIEAVAFKRHTALKEWKKQGQIVARQLRTSGTNMEKFKKVADHCSVNWTSLTKKDKSDCRKLTRRMVSSLGRTLRSLWGLSIISKMIFEYDGRDTSSGKILVVSKVASSFSQGLFIGQKEYEYLLKEVTKTLFPEKVLKGVRLASADSVLKVLVGLRVYIKGLSLQERFLFQIPLLYHYLRVYSMALGLANNCGAEKPQPPSADSRTLYEVDLESIRLLDISCNNDGCPYTSEEKDELNRALENLFKDSKRKIKCPSKELKVAQKALVKIMGPASILVGEIATDIKSLGKQIHEVTS